jgi:hypothetical protein
LQQRLQSATRVSMWSVRFIYMVAVYQVTRSFLLFTDLVRFSEIFDIFVFFIFIFLFLTCW